MCELMVAKTNAYIGAGSVRKLQRGVTVLCADHPLVKRSPQLFEPLTVAHHCGAKGVPAVVEQATAEPGEKRSIGRRKKTEPEAAPAPEVTPEVTPGPANDKATE